MQKKQHALSGERVMYYVLAEVYLSNEGKKNSFSSPLNGIHNFLHSEQLWEGTNKSISCP